MSTNIYFIIGGIAVIFVVYLMILKKFGPKGTVQPNQEGFQETNAVIARPQISAEELSEEKKKLLAYGAILAYHKSEEISGITPKSNLNDYVAGLSNQWGINSAEDAHETVKALLDLNRSSEFDQQLVNPSAEVGKIRKKIASELKLDLTQVQQTSSTYGWDIGRAIPLIKWCYWIGYLTEAECWSYMKLAADIAKQNGKNWTDYTVSFLLGRTMQGFDLDDVIVEADAILKGKQPTFRKIKDLDVCQKYTFN